MARHVATTLVSDLSGSVNNVSTVQFTFDRGQYEMELDEDELAEYREMMERYVKVAHRRRGNPTKGGKLAYRKGAAIREWALREGLIGPVQLSGRLPNSVIAAYVTSHPGEQVFK